MPRREAPLPPPHDLDAEGALLGWILDHSAEPIEGLEPKHFYLDSHRRIFEAIRELEGEWDLVQLRAKLQDLGRLEQVGGSAYLVQLLEQPACLDPSHHVARVRELWARRELRAAALAASVSSPTEESSQTISRLEGALETLRGQARQDREWPVTRGEDLLTVELPPVPWVVPHLQIGPGRACGLWGQATVGKTLHCIALAVAVASGRAVYERYRTNRTRVLYVNVDSSKYAIILRVRQFCNGMGIDPEDVLGWIEVVNFPGFTLVDDDAEHKLVRHSNGFGLAIFDCLRDGCPGVDENDSRMGIYVRKFARASETNGTTWVYTHHLRKSEDGEARKFLTLDSGRGSTSIAASSGAIWGGVGEERDPRRWQHLKPHDAAMAYRDPFHTELIVGRDGLRTFPVPEEEPASFRLCAQDENERSSRAFAEHADRALAAAKQREERIISWIATHPESSGRDLRSALSGLGRTSNLGKLLSELCAEGKLLKSKGRGNTDLYSAADASVPESDPVRADIDG